MSALVTGDLLFEEPFALVDAPGDVLADLLTATGVLPGEWQISHLETRTSPLGTHHRFRFLAHDLVLLDHIAQLHVDPTGAVWYASHSLETALPTGVQPPTFSVSINDATLLAEHKSGGAVISTEAGWKLNEQTIRPAWRVETFVAPDDAPRLLDIAAGQYDPMPGERHIHGIHPVEGVASAPRLDIDANTGVILDMRETLAHATGTGLIYRTSPMVEAQDFDMGDLPGGPDTPETLALMERFPFQGLSTAPGELGRLVGEHVQVVGTAFSPLLNFTYPRATLEFQEAMAYWHTDDLQRNLQRLGFDDANNESQVIATANSPGLANAFYQPGTDTIVFGSHGGTFANADTAEDGEVIIHENGHAIHHDMVPDWGGGDQGSMGEGFSDFLANAILSSASEGFGDFCVAEWWTSHIRGDDPPCLRNMDNDFTYSQIGNSGVHTAGQLWSGLLYDLWQHTTADTALSIVIASHYLMDGSKDMAEAADTLILADRSLSGGVHELFIAQNAHDREFAGPLALEALGIDDPGPGPGPGPSTASYYLVEEIEAQHVSVTGWNSFEGDEQVETVSIPTTPYFDSNVSSMSISTNGFVVLDGPATNGCCTPGTIPGDDHANGMIAGLWTDLDTGGCGAVHYDVSAELVRVAFRNVTYFPQSCVNPAADIGRLLDGETEAALTDFWMSIEPETGTIEIHLLRVDGGSVAATGIESGRGDAGNQTRHTADELDAPLAWRFARVHVEPTPPDDDPAPLMVPSFTAVSPDHAHPGHEITLLGMENGAATEALMVDGTPVPFSSVPQIICDQNFSCREEMVPHFSAPDLPTGSYAVGVENAEGNGTTVEDALNILQPADLTIVGLEVIDPHIMVGGVKVPTEPWTVRVTATNQGTEPTRPLSGGADALQFNVHVIGIPGDTFTPVLGPRNLNTIHFAGLEPGESATVEIKWDTRTRAMGDYELTASVHAFADDAEPADNVATTQSSVFVSGQGGM